VDEIPLPFDDLIAELKTRRFSVGVEQRVRLYRLLEKIEGQCEPEQLRTLLCPIFATTKEQQAEFYRLFDSRYAVFHTANSQQNSEVEAQRTKGRAPRGVRYLLPIIGAAALTLGILAGQVFIAQSNRPIPKRPPVSTPSGTIKQNQKFETPASPLVIPAEAPRPHPHPSFGQLLARYRDALHWSAVLIPFLGFVCWETHRRWRRNLVLEKSRMLETASAWLLDVPTQPLSPYNARVLASTARKLRRRQTSEIYRFDVALTVATSMQSLGYPVLRFRPDTRFPDYLVLIDRASPGDHLAALFSQLTRALEQENVFIDRFFFENDPRLCWSDSHHFRVSLVELQKKFPEHKLLIFSDAENLLDSVSGQLASWTASLCEWRERALLTVTPPSCWGFAERRVATQFIVVPATLDGIDRLTDSFDTGLPPDFSTIGSPTETELRKNKNAPGIEDVRSYLGEPVFYWLCACAVYPELRWELTLYLGSLGAIGENLVTERNLLKLAQLPWFRAGSIPDPMRLVLIESLGNEKEYAVREAIVEVFKRYPASNWSSYARRRSQLTVLAQNALRFRNQRKRLKSVLRELPPADIARDYVLLRLVQNTPLSKLLFLLPRSLRRIVVEDGVPLFGLTGAFRVLITVATMGILWWSVHEFADLETKSRPAPARTPLALVTPTPQVSVAPTPLVSVTPQAGIATPSLTHKLPSKLVSVAVTVGDLGNPFFIQIVHGAQAVAKRINPAVKYTAESSNYDVNNQTNQMDNFIASGVNLILLNAADSKGIAPAVIRAKAAGVTVVAVDVGAEGGVDATVISNNKQAGQLNGKFVTDRLKGKGQVVIVNGPPVTAVTDRVAGFTEILKQYPDIKILSQDQNAGGSRDGGMRVMTDLMSAFPKIDAVFAINDPTAIGCDLAAKQQRRKDFFIVSVDGAPDVVPLLKDTASLIAATAAQDPYTMGGKAVEVGYDIINGKRPDQPLILIPVTLITKENVDQYRGWAK
jgi:ribose transport system substrate-binding protein